ncbi:MAG: 3-phosphoglycerate dehydrogenase [Clostridia bacterium]|nr:3-phosphoglycerate dehydrogenase [Clostridia bacterium]
MIKILTLNPISEKIFPVLGENYTVSEKAISPDAILVRSYNMHGYTISENLIAVARAGAGVNNIPIEEYTDKGIVVFNTPGANANGVKELVICGMLMATRNVPEALFWTKSLSGKGDLVPELVEKGKKPFVGTELYGKTLGIVGLGAIGAKVANSCSDLGMNIMGYDPFLTDAAKNMLTCSVNFVTDLNALYRNSDIITFHVPLLDTTRGMISKESISFMKDGVILINMSRAELVSIQDLSAALENGKVRKYVVDFPTDSSIDKKGIIAIPHLGASTEESEDNCAVMAAQQLKDYIEDGNIKNSVNFPNLSIQRSTETRICIAYNSSSNALARIKALVKDKPLFFSEKKSIGYAVVDLDTCADISLDELTETEDILLIRII